MYLVPLDDNSIQCIITLKVSFRQNQLSLKLLQLEASFMKLLSQKSILLNLISQLDQGFKRLDWPVY